MEVMQCHPIGTYIGSQKEKYMAPKQSFLGKSGGGHLVLNAGCNFEQALEDLAGFERIWVIYWFHHNQNWKPKVTTPRGGQKRGVFATRSPHRPNPIGISAVQLIEIRGRELYLGPTDLLDGTPILDIKPYICYADAFPNSLEGWTNNEQSHSNFNVKWDGASGLQGRFIEEGSEIPFIDTVELRMATNPYPHPSHRIKQMDAINYQLALKTWRINYSIKDHDVRIQEIISGYDEETLNGKKPCPFNDLPLHLAFRDAFGKESV